MSGILVIAPHADDETFGCGGFILKEKSAGVDCHWLLMTNPSVSEDYSEEFKRHRQQTIEDVGIAYGFNSVTQINNSPSKLEDLPAGVLIGQIKEVIERIKPECVLVPFWGDIHSDHRVTCAAAISATKWFRAPSVKRILAYETVSETDAVVGLGGFEFKPTLFVDISDFWSAKTKIITKYADQLGESPFPRSARSIEALAVHRGSISGGQYAEAFVIMRWIS